MSNGQALERMRNYLWATLQDGAVNQNPRMAETILTALRSTNPEWVSSVFDYIRIQGLKDAEEAAEDAKEPLFLEPQPHQLTGEIFVGKTITGGFDVVLPLKSFGYHGHVLVAGASGTGKSYILHLISAQLMAKGAVAIVYDTLDQAARLLVPLVPANHLSVIDYRDYRRNFLLGPPGTSQVEWLRQASAHLIESLQISPVTMNYLIEVCSAIISTGAVATIPRVLEVAKQVQGRSQSAKALLNRLLPLVMTGDEVFTCERGFDLHKLFSRSCIMNLKEAPPMAQRLINNDHYFYFAKSHNVLDTWRLKMVFVYHEAGSMLNEAGNFFLKTVREARNYGIGLLFADQAPQLENPVIRSNIGTKGLLRLEDPASLEGLRVGMNLKEEHRNFILNMPDRCMLLRRPDIPYPFLVKIPNLR